MRTSRIYPISRWIRYAGTGPDPDRVAPPPRPFGPRYRLTPRRIVVSSAQVQTVPAVRQSAGGVTVLNRSRVGLAFAALLCLATTSSAFINLGDPWSGNSWGQRFDHSTLYNFDTMRIDWLYGSQFELPTVFEEFDNYAWSASWENPVLASARGAAVNHLEFNILFTGDIVPTGFTFATYLNGTAREYVLAEYRSDMLPTMAWFFSTPPGDPPPDPPLPVPEPTSLLLLGGGFLTTGVARLGMRKRIS